MKNMTLFQKVKAIIVILLLVMLAFICFPKIKIKDSIKVEKNKVSQTKDITDDKKVSELQKQLINDNRNIGLYLNGNISIKDSDNKYLIGLYLKKYFDNSNLSYINDPYTTSNGDVLGTLNYSVSKKEFNNYMKDIFKTKNKYDLEINENDFDNAVEIDKCVYLLVDEDNFKFVSNNNSCRDNYIATKLIKAEEENNNIYIYEKAVICGGNSNYWCNRTLADLSLDKAVLDCVSDNCPVELDIKKMAEYELENDSNNLNTYKHTFKKDKDDNYYWYSTEIEN